MLGNLSKKEQIEYSQALKGMAGQAGRGEELAGADKAYGALKRAESSLNEEASLPRSIFGLLGVGTKSLPGGSAVTSALSQAAVKGSQGIPAAQPSIRQFLLNKFGFKE
jgi:hypothetical protein